MSKLELVLWSLAVGAIAAVAVARMIDLALFPDARAIQGVAYHGTVLLFVALLSGLAEEVVPWLHGERLLAAQVLIGPISTGLANLWIRNWLAASQRDRLMAGSLLASTLLTPLAGLLCLALPPPDQLPAAAAVCLLSAGLTLALAVRACLLGDRLAPVMAAGCLLSMPAIAGLYALAMHMPDIGLTTQALLALAAALCNGLTGFVLWRRALHERRARRAEPQHSQFDALTKLYTGMALVRKLFRAQRRRRRTRREGAVLAIMVFDVERVVAQVGIAGLNEMYIHLGARIQRQVGVVNPVGRYYDRCFVALVEAIHSPVWLRTLGLRVAANLRRPMEVTGMDGSRCELRLDIGVGVVHLTRRNEDVEDILADAQRMAEAARAMRSRTAILDPVSGEIVPVEEADLGEPRRRPLTLGQRGLKPLQRPRPA